MDSNKASLLLIIPGWNMNMIKNMTSKVKRNLTSRHKLSFNYKIFMNPVFVSFDMLWMHQDLHQNITRHNSKEHSTR